MEVVYFVLGSSIALLVLVAIEIFTTTKKLEKLEEEFQFHERNSYDATVGLHRRIDDEVRELRTQLKEVEESIQNNQILTHQTN